MTPFTKVVPLSSVDLMLLSKNPAGSLWTCTALFSSLLPVIYTWSSPKPWAFVWLVSITNIYGLYVVGKFSDKPSFLLWRHYVHSQKRTQTMNLAPLYRIQSNSSRASSDHTNCYNLQLMSRRHICKCEYSTTHTMYLKMIMSSVMNWDETTLVKRTLP